MTEHKHLTQELGFSGLIQAPVVGLSGGIVIMWNYDILKIDEVSTTSQGINFMIKAYAGNYSLERGTAQFQAQVSTWNKIVFGNIFYKKKHILARLGRIQKFRAYPFSSFLQKLEGDLLEEYSLILNSEDIFWRTKSRISWLMEGDANTKFFHTSTLNRRRRNKINALQGDVGNWIENRQEIKDTIYQFYNNIYTTDHHSLPTPWQSSAYNTNILSSRDQARLNAPLRISEIKTAMFSFKTTKAPGLDGLRLLF
uniref:Uncharacterized protein n=1 Tax=Nicotiana tabacum TaxID=4097 RepID=A0A1S3X1J1_TOBAC|nr:PREDICTED: uncharacterized protein LOC107760269 [Nicotiana tabacum]